MPVARAKRNTGFSRKAQVSVFAGYLVAVIAALVGAALLIISIWQPSAFSGLRSAAGDATSPAGNAGASVRNGSQDVLDAISGFYQAGRQNAQLKEEVELARVKLAEAEAIKQENVELRDMLGVQQAMTEQPVAVGRLIGSSSSSVRRFAFLNVGRRDGVTTGMPVRAPKGLVGRVVETGYASSRILLLTDQNSVVPVRRATDDLIAFAEGNADGTLRIRPINVGMNTIKEGDVFVTSGAGGLFQPGIAVGVATQLYRDGAVARLLTNPAATRYVFVDSVWQPDAQKAPEELLDDVTANAEEVSPASADNTSGTE